MLTELIQRVRTDLGSPNLPFVVGQVYENGQRASVIAAQKATVQAVPHTAFVEIDGLTTHDKGTHFDTPSQIELGKRFAREMQSLLTKPEISAAPAK